MENIVIEELKYTPGKTVIKFRNDMADPHLKTATIKGMGEIDRSHIVEAAQHMISEQRKRYQEELEAEKNQGKLDFEGESDGQEEGDTIPEEVPEDEPIAGSVPEVNPDEVEFENTDYSTYQVPVVSNTTIPDFPCMEKEHACWLIDNRYGDDDEQFIYGLEELKQDMQYFGWKLNQRSLETAQKRAKEYIMGQ
jgi:hypothetical protein